MKAGGWVFISHSHIDIDNVRKIRNHLEKLGFEPLMFYLKCLSDENEIEELIKREIDEREWFIYADSPNARASTWVRTEREYIETLDGKNIFTIDLSSDIDTQLRQIEHITRQMKVFISYNRADKEIKMKLAAKLLERDMQVSSDEEVAPFGSWDKTVFGELQEYSRDGFVLLLITEGFASSMAIKTEIELAKKENAKIIPVYVGNAKLPNDLLEQIGNIEGISISESPSEKELKCVANYILSKIEFY